MARMNDEIEQVLTEIKQKPFQQILPQVNKLKQLLKSHDVNGQDANGDTLLHIVVKSDHFRGHNTIQEGNEKPENVFDLAYLTNHFSPNPFVRNNQGMTPAMLASHLKLTSSWQFLNSYERSYIVRSPSRVIEKISVKCKNLFECMPKVKIFFDSQKERDM